MNFHQKVQEIIKKDTRFKVDAYEFLMQALWFTQKKLKRQGHVTGKELLEGIREFGLEQYGPMTKSVFSHWGITKTGDFGEIVYAMVNYGLMSKTDKDSLDDFKDVYDFNEALDVFGIAKRKPRVGRQTAITKSRNTITSHGEAGTGDRKPRNKNREPKTS